MKDYLEAKDGETYTFLDTAIVKGSVFEDALNLGLMSDELDVNPYETETREWIEWRDGYNMGKHKSPEVFPKDERKHVSVPYVSSVDF
jgi:hypothetical protein